MTFLSSFPKYLVPTGIILIKIFNRHGAMDVLQENFFPKSFSPVQSPLRHQLPDP